MGYAGHWGETITRMHFSRLCLNGSVAQLVEQWSEEPRVGSSILSGSTKGILPIPSESMHDAVGTDTSW